MSKKSIKRSKPQPEQRIVPLPRTFLAGIDPANLFERIDSLPSSSPYWTLYRQALASYLEEEGQEAVNMAALLDDVDAATGVETAMRKAGFLLGFESCRQILLGELDPALKGGAE